MVELDNQNVVRNQGCLTGYRALDLTDEKGSLCGALLGGFGVDVIKIEKPQGDSSRHIGPFYHDVPDPEKSLHFWAYNINKRGITLDIQTRDGQVMFRKLAEKADFVIECFEPGYLDGVGLGYRDLEKVNPRLIMTSITPFGQTGSHAHYKASDMVTEAMGGKMYITGDPDRPPVRMSFPQARLHGSIHAAVASLIAHYYREVTGQGQQVDVSIQECVIPIVGADVPLMWYMNRLIYHRGGGSVHRGQVRLKEIWPCKDGYVNFRLMGGKYAHGIRPLVKWIEEEGLTGALIEIGDWEAMDVAKSTQEQINRWEDAFSNFFKGHTVAELYQEAVKRRFYLGPCYSPEQVAHDRQLGERGYWIQVEHPELKDTIKYPGPPFKFGLTPWCIHRRAPSIGENNREIYQQELGLSRGDLVSLKEANVI